jgi:hypothetical protein
MKRDSFFLEFIKSGPFVLLLVLAILILLGVIISNRKHDVVQMKEDVMYVAPKPKN